MCAYINKARGLTIGCLDEHNNQNWLCLLRCLHQVDDDNHAIMGEMMAITYTKLDKSCPCSQHFQ